MKRNLLLAFLLLCSAMLFAHGNAEQQMLDSNYYTAVDANGRSLKLEAKPIDVMVAGKAGNMSANALFLFPEVEQMNLTLPKTDQGLGDFFSFLRPALNQKPRLSQQASVEEIASKNPDVVLMKASHYQSIALKLDQLGVPNFTMNLESYDQWKSELTQLGKLLKNTARASELVGFYQSRLNAITARTGSLPSSERKRVLVLQGMFSDNTYSYKIAPDDWMQTWMVEQAGGIPVWKGANKAANGWSTVSFEQIAAWDPQIIILVSYNTPSSKYVAQIAQSKLWEGLDAVKNHQVLASPSDMMSYIQPVASWILGLQWMAKEIHPSLFKDMDMKREVQSFYKDFYALKDEAKLSQLFSLYEASVASNEL